MQSNGNGVGGQQHQISEIQTLREELGLYRFFVEDLELREEISEWIERSQSLTAGTQNAFMQEQLSELRTEYPMRWVPEQASGAECFPDDCSDCKHYGNACPVVSDRERRRSRRRRLQEADTPTESRGVWMDIHHETGCHRIPTWLQEWREQYQPLIEEGHELLEAVQDLTMDATGDREQLPEEYREAVDSDDVMTFGGATDA